PFLILAPAWASILKLPAQSNFATSSTSAMLGQLPPRPGTFAPPGSPCPPQFARIGPNAATATTTPHPRLLIEASSCLAGVTRARVVWNLGVACAALARARYWTS